MEIFDEVLSLSAVSSRLLLIALTFITLSVTFASTTSFGGLKVVGDIQYLFVRICCAVLCWLAG